MLLLYTSTVVGVLLRMRVHLPPSLHLLATLIAVVLILQLQATDFWCGRRVFVIKSVWFCFLEAAGRSGTIHSGKLVLYADYILVDGWFNCWVLVRKAMR